MRKIDEGYVNGIDKDKYLSVMARRYDTLLANREYTLKTYTGKNDFDFIIAPTNFCHLIGLHKFYNPNSEFECFKDKENLKKMLGLKLLKNGTIKYEMLEKARNEKGEPILGIEFINERIKGIEKLSKCLKDGDVYKFDPSKCEFYTHLKKGYIFRYLDNKVNKEYCLVFTQNDNPNDSRYYPTSFLVNSKGNERYEGYVRNQIKIEVHKIKSFHIKFNNIETIRFNKSLEKNIFRGKER